MYTSAHSDDKVYRVHNVYIVQCHPRQGADELNDLLVRLLVIADVYQWLLTNHPIPGTIKVHNVIV